MEIWDRLSRVDINNKGKFQKIFAETIKKIQDNAFPLDTGEIDEEDFYFVIEVNRMNSYFVHNLRKRGQIDN